MWIVRVRDRGRDLATHRLETDEEARTIARIYELLGYAPDKILVERLEGEAPRAA